LSAEFSKLTALPHQRHAVVESREEGCQTGKFGVGPAKPSLRHQYADDPTIITKTRRGLFLGVHKVKSGVLKTDDGLNSEF
jgi:hypothetical protein